jgi:pyruvate dehydrogenase E2 component (dihydrolipoamide acetyltransferase)
MATAVIMPKLGLTMTAGAVAQWNAAEGERVREGEVIVEVMTEKITYQVDCPADGVLLSIVVAEGEEVPVGATIGLVGEPGEDISSLLNNSGGAAADPTSATSSAATTAGPATTALSAADECDVTTTQPAGPAASVAATAGVRVPSSPAARKRALEIGLDVATIRGTGPGGRVTLEDVEAAARLVAPPAEGTGPAAPSTAAATPGVQDMPSSALLSVREELGYSGVRRAIGEHMARSWTTSPMVTHHVRADVHDLVRLLADLNEGRDQREKISLTAAVIKASARALQAVPQVNASLVGEVIRVWRDVNVGVAVAVPGGLMVPVVRGADGKGVGDIAREVGLLARRARQGRLLPDDLTGGTFTVSSLAGYRSVDWFTPIINQPEAAILGVGRVLDEVLAVEGAPAVRSTAGLSLTFDHRVIDGGPAAEFLRALLDYLEHPLRLLV